MTDVHVLASTQLINELPGDVIESLRTQAEVRHFERNELIFQEGDRAEELYVVQMGQVAIATKSVDGRESVVAVLEPPSLFGELPLFDEAPRMEADALLFQERGHGPAHDRAGHRHVKLFVSGGLDEGKILDLNEAVDGGYGVGTAISSASTIDYSMDIVEVEGEAVAKRGKLSGGKHFLRCRACGAERVIPLDRPYGDCEACGGAMEQLLAPVMRAGEPLAPPEPPRRLRERVLAQLHRVGLDAAG